MHIFDGLTTRDAIGAAMLVALSCLSTPAAADRNDQWMFRETLGAGDDEPTAVFLSWDYRHVVFRATCDRSTRELVAEYFGNDVLPLTASEQLEVHGRQPVVLATRLVNGVLVGRVKAGPDLLLSISGAEDLEVYAPNEMGNRGTLDTLNRCRGWRSPVSDAVSALTPISRRASRATEVAERPA
jgi:hypothetical protein